MSNDFLPLSGAILVTNPRPKVKNMALALKNPNDRRRFNKLARLVVQEGMSPKAAVALWERNKNKPAKSRDRRLRPGDGKAMMSYIASGRAKPQNRADKAAYSRARDAIAREFARKPGYKPSSRYVFGRKFTASYPRRI